ncbi:FAD-dependent oxidoreductase [Dyella mobilis]|uniref:Flavin-dependent monooxygenase n=1 Tax=Dyella mobilis TaxID=1849582 RepID=A0ABS2KF96_9GAMM|nr:FAD-dependent monooxygenase [Dyella mobilis]MBM7129053.1 FAD-dependent monooxygenase [Dyella mobilis]GLQ99246.1 monooxygenase [Dyella mobilis]
MTTPALAKARIAIIGGGPGGLTCARILQRRGLNATVYERDLTAEIRDQGGSLDLHEDNGQIALREAGLLEEFFRLARPEGQQMRKLNSLGHVLDDELPEEGNLFKPEIDRGQLRDLLLASLRPETVQWGKSLAYIEGPSYGPRWLRFEDGSSAEVDLVIGADGAFSKVRSAVSEVVPYYSGVTFLEAWFHDIDQRHGELAALIGQGTAFAADGERCLVAQRSSASRMRAYVVRRLPLNWMEDAGLFITDTNAIRAYLLDEFRDWSPRMKRLITDNDGPYVSRPLFVLPVPHKWEHVPTATLLGDAAHLMPPLGVGVNLAMLDASDLACALSTSNTISEAVSCYEDLMLPRSIEIARMLEGAAEHLLRAHVSNADAQ